MVRTRTYQPREGPSQNSTTPKHTACGSLNPPLKCCFPVCTWAGRALLPSVASAGVQGSLGRVLPIFHADIGCFPRHARFVPGCLACRSGCDWTFAASFSRKRATRWFVEHRCDNCRRDEGLRSGEVQQNALRLSLGDGIHPGGPWRHVWTLGKGRRMILSVRNGSRGWYVTVRARVS